MTNWLKYSYTPAGTNAASVETITNDTMTDFPAGSLWLMVYAAGTDQADPGSYTQGTRVIFYQIPDALPAQGVLNNVGTTQNTPAIANNPYRVAFSLWQFDQGQWAPLAWYVNNLCAVNLGQVCFANVYLLPGIVNGSCGCQSANTSSSTSSSGGGCFVESALTPPTVR
ncbi:MAG: hypothetical protein AB1921_07235 [Thermodesulfobacteriota bacterium]